MKAQLSFFSLLLILFSSFVNIQQEALKPTNENLTLKTIMRLIMTDMNLINEGIYTQDFSLIQQGAAAINQHPPLSNTTLNLIKKTLGKRMPVFAEFDKTVHGHADSLKVAAINQDMTKVLEQYHIIEKGCIACHAAFRDEIKEAIAGSK